MSEYTPNIDAVNQLRGELIEVLNDYVLLVMFNGISSPDDVQRLFFSLLNGLRGDEDLSSEPSFLARQREEGVTAARRLLQVLGEIDDVRADDLRGVAEALPRWVAIREEYAGVHERFESLRTLALVWGIDVSALVRRGRPAVTSRKYTKETFWPAVREARALLRKRGHQHPSQERIAEILGVSVRYYYNLKKQYGPEIPETN
jgi:hypothetical protein